MSNAAVVTKLEVPTTTRQVMKVFRSSTVAERSNGREWYRRARTLAEDLVTLYGTNFAGVELYKDAVERAAAVIAVLSPRLAWTKNVELAHKVYADMAQIRSLTAGDNEMLREMVTNAVASFPGLKTNGSKAYALLLGTDPEDVVSGPKVTAFWRTITNPFDPRAVVVDRHALDVAMGKVLDDRQRGIILGRKGAYDALSDLYRRAAKQLTKETGAEWTPAEVQATTWVVWRRNHAAKKGAAQREGL